MLLHFFPPIGGKSPSGAGAVKRMSEMNFSDCKRMPWKSSCPAQARQEILRKSMNFSGSSHRYRSHLWTVQEERKSLKQCHGLTSSFRSRPALRSANVPVLRARACLQRVDVLRTVSTHSPAFHHGGLSGEIARFGISHLCVDLVLVIGDCALQLCATGEHVFRSGTLPNLMAFNGG